MHAHPRPVLALALAAAPALALVPTLPAAPAQDPVPGLSGAVRARSLVADVKITDGVATTRLALTLANDGTRPVEATWVLPVPPGSVADDFRLTVGGVETRGEVLDAGAARGVYERIVRARRDPGLLEFLGRGCLRARVFPIPPRGEMKVELAYRELLPEVGGLRRWSFPLAAAGVHGRPPEEVVLDLAIESRRALHNVFSPTPGLQVAKRDDHSFRASYEGRGERLGERELVVFHGLSDKEFGLDLLSTRAKGAEEGTFLMLVSPRRDVAEEDVTKRSIVFVLDTSGSMAGPKIAQARGALEFFVRSLRPGERFNVVPFATEAEPFFPAPVPLDAESRGIALERAARLEASGGTNLSAALRAALAPVEPGGDHVPIVVLLTDGRPTVQERDPARILATARGWNRAGARVFVFGVGNDVNTHLLDTLSGENGGTRAYVRLGEDIEVATSDLFGKISRPVLTDLALDVEGLELEKLAPSELPDLFHGSRLQVFGRYRGAGPYAIRLTGRVAGERREYVYEGTFADGPVPDFDFVPGLWAERRVAVLLDAIRLHGPDTELVDEVRRLGTEHNIVTPYTSHLVLEEGLALGGARGGRGGTWRGTGDTVPPGGGGGGGGGGSASPGPAGPSTPGPATPGAPAGAPTSGAGRARGGPDLDAIARSLRDAGVLPADAPPAELRRLALEVAAELRAADGALRDLGRESSGRRAVEDSAYLAGLVEPERLTGSDDFFLGRGQRNEAAPSAILAARFVRKVRDKVFVLRAGVWTDRALPAEASGGEEANEAAERTVVEAWSDAWFELLRREPRLAPYFAFSPRIVVALDGVVYEVRPAEAVRAAADTDGDAGAGTGAGDGGR